MIAAVRKRLFARPNTWPGAVLVDGFVTGSWKITRPGAAAVLTGELFSPVAGADRDALLDEGGRLLSFTAPDAPAHDVRFGPLP